MAEWTVLKMGGSLQGAGLQALSAAIGWCQGNGHRVVVVHGGGPRISGALEAAGIELPFVHGERLTTPEGMAVVERVLGQEVNAELTKSLRGAGIDAVGLSGTAGTIIAAPLPGRGRTARVGRVNVRDLQHLTALGHVPVLAPIGADEQGLSYNINADLAAGAVAGALAAQRVVFLTDVPGIYENFAAKQLMTDASAAELERLLSAGRFHSGMIPKVNAVLAALTAGVQRAYVVDGTDARALQWAVEADDADLGSGSDRDFGTRVQMEAVG